MDDVGISQEELERLLGQEAPVPNPSLSGAPHGFRDWLDSPELPRRKTDELPSGFFEQRTASVRRLIIHHTEGDANGVKEDNRFHTEGKDWSDGPGFLHAPHIAYHFYIERDGLLIGCNNLWEQAWHARSANPDGVGIVLRGNFDHKLPANEQLQTLQWLVERLMAHLHLDLGDVSGHGEVPGNSKSCPGSRFSPSVGRFRSGVPFWTVTGTIPQIRWRVLDPQGVQTGLYNVTTNAVADAERTGGIGIYQSEGRIRIDFRGAANNNPNPPAKWRVLDANNQQLGLYNHTENAVREAERARGYGRYMLDSPQGVIRMDFRGLTP